MFAFQWGVANNVQICLSFQPCMCCVCACVCICLHLFPIFQFYGWTRMECLNFMERGRGEIYVLYGDGIRHIMGGVENFRLVCGRSPHPPPIVTSLELTNLLRDFSLSILFLHSKIRKNEEFLNQVSD